mmetsp:Transcript_25682/g.31638  ORF Transcript_25682/g.31638 Transcript_25682/m.31638 type:complete len:277 (-) Transcript_25682:1369-2199(-)
MFIKKKDQDNSNYQDDMNSLSSLSLNTDNSSFEELVMHGHSSAVLGYLNERQSIKFHYENDNATSSPTTVQVDSNFIPLKAADINDDIACPKEQFVEHDANTQKYGSEEDIWTTQGNRSEKTDTSNTFVTEFTNTTGATKLHQNGVSAILRRKLRKKKSQKEEISVPTSINTIRRPMTFDVDERKLTALKSPGQINTRLVSPSQVQRGMSYQAHQNKVYSTSKLKDGPSLQYNNEIFYDEITVPEDGDYHAGSASIEGLFQSLFRCCAAGNDGPFD